MKHRLWYGIAFVVLVISVLLVAWPALFNVRPLVKPEQTIIFGAVSALTFVLMVTLGWILIRTGIKLYVERQSDREGSRIKTKLVAGALALSFIPVFFLVAFCYDILNYNLKAMFQRPAQNQLQLLLNATDLLEREVRNDVRARAALLALQPETLQLLAGGPKTPGFLERFCGEQGLLSATIYPPDSDVPMDSWYAATRAAGHVIVAQERAGAGDRSQSTIVVERAMPLDVAQSKADIIKQRDSLEATDAERKGMRRFYTMMMALITMFVLFVATWIALFLSKQIGVPITALLEAASEVRRGNLGYRVEVKAADELGTLVRSFNQMTQALEANRLELDRRSRFTEAILESIPTGVISVRSDGSILRVNSALAKLFPEQAAGVTRLEDLFSRDDTAEIKYLMKRARRTGAANRQIELHTRGRKLQIEVTVSALEEKLTSGFVIVLEDATELLRAQKTAAWREVARRVAHEIKNPLTPIALSAERISRQIEKLDLPSTPARILKECAATIGASVESVKTLVDEFSQFARFPSAQPAPADLNEIVREALAVFHGRLDGIAIRSSLAPDLPPVNVDREQFRRVVINLVDNAAEAMQDSLVKNLEIVTLPGAADTVDLIVADTGVGISAEDKEKLFLPYFSTKNRGTGLGLAIVSHIVGEHNAQIRVEDNRPTGARFTVEIPAILELETAEPAARPAAIDL